MNTDQRFNLDLINWCLEDIEQIKSELIDHEKIKSRLIAGDLEEGESAETGLLCIEAMIGWEKDWLAKSKNALTGARYSLFGPSN